jgi:hypothetical protein
MTLFTTLRANQEVQRLRATATRLGYETGYYGLPDQSSQWIDSQVRLVAQHLYGQRVAPATLQSEVERLESAMTQATAAANATRAQVDLQPALVPTLRWPRVTTVCAATYLMGESLQFTVGELTVSGWLTLGTATGLATAPWMLSLPIVAGYRSRWTAWRAARKVRSLRRRVTRKQAKLERAVAQATYVDRWIMTHIAALQQDHNVALEPAKKAREHMAQLDSFTPPTMETAKPVTTAQDNPPQPLNEATQPITIHEELALA